MKCRQPNPERQAALALLRKFLGTSQRLEAVWGKVSLPGLLVLVAAFERARVREYRAGSRDRARRLNAGRRM